MLVAREGTLFGTVVAVARAVVGLGSINWTLEHLQSISALIELDFVHYVVDK